MVAEAPAFGDVAADFKDFMQGAIFAAHNVNFDYGFIAEEYKRLGLEFRGDRVELAPLGPVDADDLADPDLAEDPQRLQTREHADVVLRRRSAVEHGKCVGHY